MHIHEFIPGTGFAALALELVDGVLLSDHLNGRAIGDAEAADMARQLASALAFFHSVGVAHLDLKPENVMRQPDGVLRLIDYGAAATFAAGRLDDAWVEETGGTEAFRAPERLDSVYDDEDEVWDEEGRINGPAADVYSLGVCCFVALTGTDLFDFDGGEDNEDGSFCLVDSYAGMLERLEAGDVFNATSTEGFHIRAAARAAPARERRRQGVRGERDARALPRRRSQCPARAVEWVEAHFVHDSQRAPGGALGMPGRRLWRRRRRPSCRPARRCRRPAWARNTRRIFLHLLGDQR